MFQMLQDHPRWHEADFTRLELVISGGAPCPLPIMEKFWDRGVDFKMGYGLTEASGNNFWLPAELVRKKIGSVGYPIFHIDMKTVRDDGSSCGDGEEGELLIRGPHVFAGYWRNPEATAETIRDGWLHTGDIAMRDADGCYFVLGRSKEMFISGGENVYPAEIESVLLAASGAVLGLLLGNAAITGLQWMLPTFPVAAPLWAPLAAVTVAIFTGLLSLLMWFGAVWVFALFGGAEAMIRMVGFRIGRDAPPPAGFAENMEALAFSLGYDDLGRRLRRECRSRDLDRVPPRLGDACCGGHQSVDSREIGCDRTGKLPVVDHDRDREALDGTGCLHGPGDEPIDAELGRRLVPGVLVAAVFGDLLDWRRVKR